MIPMSLTVKRAKDFSTTGNYDVHINGVHFIIYRDPENGWWYQDIPLKHFSECCVGFTKAEALERLTEKHQRSSSI